MNQNIISVRAKIICFVTSAIIAYFLLLTISPKKNIDFNDAATFGAKTTTTRALEMGLPIQCSDSADALECINTINSRKSLAVTLWLGNSQLHAINQYQPGELNSTNTLSTLLKKNNVDLITFSEPNANLQEQLILFNYIRTRLPIKVLILPLVFDDTREDDIRSGISSLTIEGDVKANLSNSQIGKILLKKSNETSSDDNNGLNGSLQAEVEKALNNFLIQHSKLWSFRDETRGLVFTYLYNLRNFVFDIKPSTKRKRILGPYKANMESLSKILSDANEAKIKTILYIAPILQGTEIPYDIDEYNTFKFEAYELAREKGVQLIDLESIVPTESWGLKDSTSIGLDSEIDYMHFRSSGHKILATKLHELIINK